MTFRVDCHTAMTQSLLILTSLTIDMNYASVVSMNKNNTYVNFYLDFIYN